MDSYFVIDTPIHSGSDDERQGSEYEIVESNVPIIEEGLGTICTVETKKKLRHREDHIFVEEIPKI